MIMMREQEYDSHRFYDNGTSGGDDDNSGQRIDRH